MFPSRTLNNYVLPAIKRESLPRWYTLGEYAVGATRVKGNKRMSYVGWAIVAMTGYGVTAVILKLALRDIPPGVAIVITNAVLVLAGVGLVLYRGEQVAAHLSLSRPMLLTILAGVTLSLSIVGYYIALSRGPASVVVPIFAMYVLVATVIGLAFLGEEVKLTRVIGVILAGGAIFLLTR